MPAPTSKPIPPSMGVSSTSSSKPGWAFATLANKHKEKIRVKNKSCFFILFKNCYILDYLINLIVSEPWLL